MKTKWRRLFFALLLTAGTMITVPASANSYKVKDIDKKTAYVPLVTSGFQTSTEVKWGDTVGKLITKSLTFDKEHLSINSYDYGIYITPLKTGTSNVSFKVKKNGKKTKYSFQVISFKFTRTPFTSVKFGSKRLDLVEYGDPDKPNVKKMMPPISLYNYYMTIGTKKIFRTGTDTGKISFKLRKGWKIKSAVMEYNHGNVHKTKKVSLSKKIKFVKTGPSDGDELFITFKNKKGYEVIFSITGYALN